MFTVVIAQKEHIDNINKYELFLQPFLNCRQMVFCPWYTEGSSFRTMVPDLDRLVSRRLHWRAIVLCDEEGLDRINPFDAVSFNVPNQQPEESDAEFFARSCQERCAAYDQAAKQPLVRLMTYLCQMPQCNTDDGNYESNHDTATLTYYADAADYAKDNNSGEDNEDDGLKLSHTEYTYEYAANRYNDLALECYHKTAAYKEELRRRILSDETVDIAYPQEIYCIAKRTKIDLQYEIRSAWTEHVVHQYSRFYDWNMYYDKMRYLVFDVISKEQQNYTYDYLRFLYSVLMLSTNDIPTGMIMPFRVYSLDCENDERALSRLMMSYERKLDHTAEELQERIDRIGLAGTKPLTDKDVEAFLSARVTVTVPSKFNEEKEAFYVDKKQIGLASDKPQEEKNFWATCRQRAVTSMRKLLKMPQRSLVAAVDDMRQMEDLSMERVKQLNRFQIYDVSENTDKAESEMIASCAPNINDAAFFEKKMEEYARPVQKEMELRMRSKTVLLVGGLCLLVFFFCYLPLFLNNYFSSAQNMAAAFGIAVGAVASLALAGFICLIVFRSRLRRKIADYNRSIDSIWRQIYSVFQLYSKYLSCACNVMRGNRVLNYYYENEDENTLKQRILKKHICEIEKAKAELVHIFGSYLNGDVAPDPLLTDVYDYDFNRAVEYKYPIPYMDCTKKEVRFIQCGTYVTAPVEFVTGLTVSLEELYD